MKRNSTITSNSSSTNPTAPISFAAAAQKNTTKTPAAAPTPTTPQQQSSQQPPSAPQAAAPQQTLPRQSPVKPSTANGNYSSVAAKANANAANRRSQPPTAAAAVKGQPAKPATPSAAPIQFGSINNDATESPAETVVSDDKMTFGSIPASKKAPSVNETPEVEATPEAHNTHRRTDSTSSAHSDPNSYHRPQGIPTSGAGPNFTRPPVKNHHPQGPHHGMHPGHQHPQWNQGYYVPQYDPNYYQQQQMYQQMPAYSVPSQRQPIPSRPFNTSAPAFTPQAPQPSKRIAIINPDTKTEVKPLPSVSSTAESKLPVVIDIKNPEDEKKDIVTPPPAKNVIKIVNPADREREEKERKEKEEKARKEQEEKERLEREEKERLEREAKEAEERRIQEEKAEKERLEAIARAEQERKEKEERERKEKEEREEKERLEAEQKKKEEEERIAREKAEAEAAAIAEKARLEKEKAELEAKEKLEAERRIALETEKLAEKVKLEVAEKEKAEKAEKEAAKAGLTVDIARTVSAPAPLSSARIENFGAVSYPTGIQSPINADPQGKFRYNRDFLMQFMSVCTDKPESLPSLEALGMDENDRRSQSSGGSQRGARGPVPNGRKPTQPMGSFNLGSGRPNMMGSPMGGRTMSNEFNSPRMNRSPSDNQFLPRNNNLSRPPSQRGSRGGKRGGGGGRGGHHGHQDPQLTIPIEDIVPLEKTDNAWTPNINASKAPVAISAEEPLTQEQVARKVKGLLNKLTLEKFDSISDKVIDIANLSTKEADGTTLKHCIQIIFEKATDEPNFGSVYARLCQKLMDKVSDDVKDNTVQGSTGGKLFRKYLLHRCQEEFVKGWKDKATAGGASLNDKDGPDLMSDEYYIMMKAKRQGLGLIHFIGELFKLQMLTEKIMHECVKKLLANVKDPEEEETEGLCKLMTTVGLQLDRPEAKAHMDVYFARMTELTRNLKLASRIRFMVQDVIDLRANKWVNRRAAAGPKTIAAIHEEAARQQEEKELMRRTASSGGGRGLPNRRDQLSRGQSFRGSGDARNDVGGVPQVGADGWSTVGSGPTPPKKAGDLSSFGNTSRSKVNGLPSLGPAGSGSVFGSLNKTKRAEKAAPQPESNRNSTIGSANIFAALEGDSGDRRGSVDEKPVERRRLNLLPRSTPVAEEGASTPVEKEAPKGPKKTEEEAKRSIENTLKEYLSIRDMTEMVASVAELEDCYHPLFVTEFVNQSMEMKQSDIDSVADIFKKLAGDGLISKEDFEAGFADPLEFLPDTAIDVPNAYKITAQLLEAAGLDASKAAKP
ncbi:hypothetical protein BGZ59_000938 [Podila verticillata]|nr:hypothetical protein BGZ59_000938 [Podila verticillata]KFH64548.1 hypothetical protein MVEG_09281 [Podila verticillata NRRL 6337]